MPPDKTAEGGLPDETIEEMLDFEKMTAKAAQVKDLDHKQLMADMKVMLGTPAGRRMFCRLVDVSGMHSNVFTGNSRTYYLLGRQELGKWLYSVATQADLPLLRQAEDEYRTNGEE